MAQSKNEIISYLENATVFLLGIMLLLFPLVITTATTDPFILPKQVLLVGVALLSLIFFGIKIIASGHVVIRRTPFDLPVIIFAAVALVSSFFAVNKADSIISVVPLLLVVLLFFIIVNNSREKNSVLFMAISLIGGAALLAIIGILTFLKVYILPFEFTRVQAFSTTGSILDQALYLFISLPLALYFVWPLFSHFVKRSKDETPLADQASEHHEHARRQKITVNEIAFGVGFILIFVGFILSVFELFTFSKQSGGFLILPFETGFQTAFAAISQDAGRVVLGLLFGSGFGTFATDFTRFKQIAFNQSQDLWLLTFFRSSSFILELLATTGVAGLLSFLFILFKIIRKRTILTITLLGILASFVLPFSFVIIALFFIVLAIASAMQGLKNNAVSEGYFDIELQIVALRQGLISFDNPSREKNAILSIISFIIIALIAGTIGFFSVKYLVSDVVFQQSLVAASQNNGTLTYIKQANAIQVFPYRDAYYRIFSQTNFALANSLASQQPQGQTPNQETQQTILTLIQQSINAGRSAATYSPQTALNWQNLASIYRSLIGFGQNADSFAILSNQQAIVLDPNNPTEYINLGGIYYQLGQWDNAIRQFQIAASLKPDYANAYYNLGHALEQKGSLADALSQYQIVQRLVANDKVNLDRINQEIAALEKRLQTGAAPTEATTSTESVQQGLNINAPESQLPPQNPPVKIPPPTEDATKSSKTK
ncbi:MAG: tetratricopeptide repeat protein [Candidatus Levybacteria bacterium]|nr:tetratricopeptide repeat protein [Candidatus Levybacteria bacterium]